MCWQSHDLGNSGGWQCNVKVDIINHQWYRNDSLD